MSLARRRSARYLDRMADGEAAIRGRAAVSDDLLDDTTVDDRAHDDRALDEGAPTRAASFLESRALFLHQAALELHERLEALAGDLQVVTRRVPAPVAGGDPFPTAASDVETARITAARAKMMAELFRQWTVDGTDPLRQAQDLATWHRIQEAARSLGVETP